MITNQRQEIERAVAGVGEYEIVDEYKPFKIPTRKFCQMTQQQKDKHNKSFFSSSLLDFERKDENLQGEESQTHLLSWTFHRTLLKGSGRKLQDC